MDQGNLDIQKKYEELALFQNERTRLRAKNLDAKKNYPSLEF